MERYQQNLYISLPVTGKAQSVTGMCRTTTPVKALFLGACDGRGGCVGYRAYMRV